MMGRDIMLLKKGCRLLKYTPVSGVVDLQGVLDEMWTVAQQEMNFLNEADLAVASGKPSVRLRFGHDSVVLPFSFIMGFKEAIHGTDDMENLHKQFTIFRLIPMAGNIQWIFFRKQDSDDVLVKFLMNENETSIPIETDCYPFYHWKDVSAYYRKMLKDANITYKKTK